MINEGHFRIFLESDLPLVIANQNDGWVETCYELSNDEVYEILFENVEAGVVGEDAG